MLRKIACWLCSALLTGCVGFYPDINEGCDSAADRCPDNLAYDECVNDAIRVLGDDPEASADLYDCLSGSACDAVEACLE